MALSWMFIQPWADRLIFFATSFQGFNLPLLPQKYLSWNIIFKRLSLCFSIRFKILKKGNFADGSFFYKARSPEEVMFFSRLNVLCWELHPDMTQLMEKLWQGKMKKYTEKVSHLFTENVKVAKV